MGKTIRNQPPIGKPSPSTAKRSDIGVTRPISKPSPSTSKHIGVTGPGATTKGSNKKGKC